jgi:arsenate reductase (glutaredoxin)
MNITIWHNKQCSTSRKILNFLENTGSAVEVRSYLTDPPTEEELEEVLKKMKLGPEDIIRKKETLYIDEYKGKTMSSKERIKTLAQNPRLIERPIVIKGNKAWLARPADEFIENWEN